MRPTTVSWDNRSLFPKGAAAPLPKPRQWPDPQLLVAVALLLSLGWVMVFNASYFGAVQRQGNGLIYITRHSIYLLAGIGLGFLAARVRLEAWKRSARWLFLLALVLLSLVPFMGELRNGARRWIDVGFGFTFQPAEFAKLALVLHLARFFARRPVGARRLGADIFPALTFTGVCAALVVQQPDLGTSAILACTGLAMLFFAGAPISYFVALLALVTAAGVGAIWAEPYRMRRILCLLDPWLDPQRTCFQLAQSLVAFGAGGWTGVGLGESRQKLFFLPEVHTDFIFALIGEELGVLGASFVLALFAWIGIRGLRLARREGDLFASHLAFGLTFSLLFEASFNVLVVLGVLPTKGLVMPFLSYGGSALIVALVRVGILMNISRRAS